MERTASSPDPNPCDPELALARDAVESRLFGGVVPRMGRFTVLERVGEGGMGVVYAAYDAELDRKVALKVLRRVGNDGDGRRIRREAQAMARLSHPNVAQIFEVGEHLGDTFIAMEFVRGQTLYRWQEAPRRSWRDVLDVYLQAGRGLAAAHSAGIVHRDFKPSNVLVGEDGRARVLDFGLARTLADAGPTPPVDTDASRAEASTQLTRSGALVGTPAYMAAEQIRGERVDARADQFAFCVALWEALVGERPFAGDTTDTLFAHVLRGEVTKAPTAALPRWIESVLRRGLAPDPEQRHPTLEALILALERGVGRRRVVRAAVATGLIGLAGLGAWAMHAWIQQSELDQIVAGCEAEGAEIEDVWNGDARERVRLGLTASGASYAQTTVERALPWLDAYAIAWRQARTEACLNVDVRSAWDAATLDRALWCLDDRRMELEALTQVLAQDDATAVRRAITAAAGLASVEACLDAAALERLPSPPVERREDVRAVRAVVAMASARERTGGYDKALAEAKSARERAEEIDWPPLTAAARAREARLLDRTGAYQDAERVANAAYLEAARAGAWDVAAGAALHLVFLLSDRLAKHEEALSWGGHAEVAVIHAGDREGLLEADRLFYLATAHHRKGDFPQARQLHERALAMREAISGPDHPDVATALNNLANVSYSAGDQQHAREIHERALAIRERALGPDHPEVAQSLDNLSNVYLALGQNHEARAAVDRALSIKERAFGSDHPDVAKTLGNSANVHFAVGQYEEARAIDERIIEIRERALGPDHPDVATGLNNLGNALYAGGRPLDAIVAHERALAIREKALGAEHADVAQSLENLAVAAESLGQYERARTLLQRALGIKQEALGPESYAVGRTLTNLATTHISTGAYAEARVLGERALAIYEAALGPEHPGVAQILDTLANAHTSMGEHARARELLERAISIQESALGPEHADVALSRHNLGLVHLALGEPARARTELEHARAIREKTLGSEHVATASSLAGLGELELVEGDHAAARTLLERALAIERKALGPDHPSVARLQARLGAARGRRRPHR